MRQYNERGGAAPGLQGNTAETLPEALLGTMRLNFLDLGCAPRLECDTNTLTHKVRCHAGEETGGRGPEDPLLSSAMGRG